MTAYGRIAILTLLALSLAFELKAAPAKDRVFESDITLKENFEIDGRPEGLTTTWVIKPGVTVSLDSISGSQLLTGIMFDHTGPAYFTVAGGGVLHSKRAREFGIRLGHAIGRDGRSYGGPCTLVIEGGSIARFDTEIAIFPSGGGISLKDAGSELQFLIRDDFSFDEQGSAFKGRSHYGGNGVIPVTINGAPVKLKGPDANSSYSLRRVEGTVYRCLKVLPPNR